MEGLAGLFVGVHFAFIASCAADISEYLGSCDSLSVGLGEHEQSKRAMSRRGILSGGDGEAR